MKKSLLALAALTAFAGAASAQSTVTIGGKLDLGFGKSIGATDKGLQDAAGSRLNFMITEDLGGGLKAVGGFEHRLNPDDGNSASGNFWNGFSWVGLQGGFGKVTIGRHYTSAFLNVQNQVDPWGGDTVAGLRGIGLLAGVAKIRTANSLRYDIAAGGFSFAADIAEKGKNNAGAADATVVNRPWSVAGTFAAGPVWVGLSHENPGGANDKLTNLGARFGMGPATLRAAITNGTNNANAKVKAWELGANVKMGAADLRVGYAQLKTGGVTSNKRFGLGVKYDLSKRTYLYTDFARDSKVATQKSGYDLGIQHNF